MIEIEGRMWLTNGAMIDGEPGDGPADQGTYTFLQEVLRLPNRTRDALGEDETSQ